MNINGMAVFDASAVWGRVGMLPMNTILSLNAIVNVIPPFSTICAAKHPFFTLETLFIKSRVSLYLHISIKSQVK